MRLAYWNGSLVAIGDGLLGSQLVNYLAQDFHVPRVGLGIGLIFAAPYLVGVLRIGAPAMIGRLASRKTFCVTTCLLSSIVLAMVPCVALAGKQLSPRSALEILVIGWCGYHLLGFFAKVALWSWLADLCPAEVRGRFLGVRERWMTLAQAAAMLCGGLNVWGWTELHPRQPRWEAYLVPAAVGVFFLIAAVVPLMLMPAAKSRGATGSSEPMGAAELPSRRLLEPLRDRRFLAMLAAFCWFSIVNGMISLPQNLFPNLVLNRDLLTVLALRVGTRLGQWPLGPSVGRIADRYGNRLVLALGYLIVAQAPLFYFLASAARPWWIIGAAICWIAWVGANICMPNLLLKIAPRQLNASYIALFYAATDLCHGLSMLAGGALFDRFSKVTNIGYGWNYYQASFLAAWLGYMVGVALLTILVRE